MNKYEGMDNILCTKCKEECQIFAEDYDDLSDWECAFCTMPISQLIHDVYQVEGLWEVFVMVFRRLKNELK